ncbi:hypothetical protein SELMODRAFT_431176 [Selaginella moellendorffii]|uniref:Pentatricopeptide repeat-containing protein n=1 Tax=Selaginella moellendorffii TaxID=88036 RepID=D8TBS3_SELML|nr:hypothetical protein SELMODRAFT_431176 [Selaginella moellendorffii]
MLGRSAVTYTNLLLCGTNGKLVESKRLFDEMPHRTPVSWNSMLMMNAWLPGHHHASFSACLALVRSTRIDLRLVEMPILKQNPAKNAKPLKMLMRLISATRSRSGILTASASIRSECRKLSQTTVSSAKPLRCWATLILPPTPSRGISCITRSSTPKFWAAFHFEKKHAYQLLLNCLKHIDKGYDKHKPLWSSFENHQLYSVDVQVPGKVVNLNDHC